MVGATDKIVLYGAGACGTYVLKHLRSKSKEPECFVDNDTTKIGTKVMGIGVLSVRHALELYHADNWIACAISRPAAKEIRDDIRRLMVATSPLWENMEVFHGLPPESAYDEIYDMLDDEQSRKEWRDQVRFRAKPDLDWQLDCSPKEETYFPPFIKHLDTEVFIDCGAADGDTVKAFSQLWENFQTIIAFEPDKANYRKLLDLCLVPFRGKPLLPVNAAVGDISAEIQFCAVGDKSSHISSEDSSIPVQCVRLDELNYDAPPTFIKMDIEGAELEALWGARKLIKEHAPVLAICAYHTSDHLWQIPLLMKALNPDYEIFLRRYAEGAWELVWYAVPVDRILQEAL